MNYKWKGIIFQKNKIKMEKYHLIFRLDFINHMNENNVICCIMPVMDYETKCEISNVVTLSHAGV